MISSLDTYASSDIFGNIANRPKQLLKEIEVFSKSPSILVQKVQFENDRVKLKIFNVGERVADSINVNFCIYLVNVKPFQIKDSLCSSDDHLRLAKNEKIHPNKSLELGYPFQASNFEKEYQGYPILAEIKVIYKDEITGQIYHYKRRFMWEGFEKSKFTLTPAPLAYYKLKLN